jgi:prepilin-type N-terminal cleavage/methylation domain-containing protein
MNNQGIVQKMRSAFCIHDTAHPTPDTLSSGFTLVELLVVTGIMALISGLVLANNTRFGGVAQLQNLTYDIALSIREAQIYGISVARFNNIYAPAYGMHFDSANPNAYVLFADVLSPQNGVYDCPSPGTSNCELVRLSTIQSGYSITALCATVSGGSESCAVSSLDISFERPEPDAYIRAAEISGINESARIIVSSPRGDEKVVSIEVNGQISVE